MLKELRTQHRTIIQMVFSGYKNNEIAERLEMTQSTVSQIIRSPLGQAYLEGLQDKAKEATLDVRKKLVSMNKSALNVLDRIMNPAEKAPHSVQLTAAKDVLDRTGYKAPDRLHVDMTMQTKTDQEIDAEINAMQQSIAKTYLQSPNQPTLLDDDIVEIETEPFTDEPQDEASITVDSEDMDSSDRFVNFNESSNHDELTRTHKNPVNSPPIESEESISLLSKIPADVFQN